jgi:hypothetical protein
LKSNQTYSKISRLDLEETLDYIEKHFTYHLDGLILLPSEPSFALAFLHILDEIQIPYSDVDGNLSEQRLIGIWILLKNILSWLAEVDTSIVSSCMV